MPRSRGMCETQLSAQKADVHHIINVGFGVNRVTLAVGGRFPV